MQDRLATVSVLAFTPGQPTTTVPSAAAGSLIDQPLNNQTIIRFTGATGTADAGKNLLTMIFTGDIVGFSGSPTASLLGSKASGQTVIFSSDFINFAPQLGNAYSFSLLNITPALSMGAGGFLNSFVSNIGGQFSSDIVVVPQPTSVAMFGTGIMATLVLASRRRLLRNKTAA
ncbi:MAG: hypothetical protein U0835_05045 [Isosphaeraceae bacterium]